MFTEDKVTEIFCMADDFCKFFDSMMAKYTIPTPWERVGVRSFIPSIRCIHMFRDAMVCELHTNWITHPVIVNPRYSFVCIKGKGTIAVIIRTFHKYQSFLKNIQLFGCSFLICTIIYNRW